jgi:hypothetical protein
MFYINNTQWNIAFVSPKSNHLRRSDGSKTLGVTDWNIKTVFLSNELHGDKLEHVLCHELCHCVCFSWNISLPIDVEEWLCNYMADHGKEIIYLLDDLLYEIKMQTA